MLELLISRKADLNIENYNRWCPIHIAVRNGQYDAVKAILKHNAKCKQAFDLNAQGGTKQWSPLHLAALSRQL